MLSEAAWERARRIGVVLQPLCIPAAAVVASEYCRARQAADIAFGRHVTNPALNFAPAETYSDASVAAMHDRMRRLLATTSPAGHNTVLAGTTIRSRRRAGSTRSRWA